MDTLALVLAILGGLAGVAGLVWDQRATAGGVVLLAIATVIILT